jgi:ferredoxin-thioredoxin reductase catalytic subunit
MNEKINQFKQQAGIQDNPDQEGLDLFAKLILEEAANFAEQNCACNYLGKVVLSHFGIK